MTYTEKFISFHVIERENNQNFLTWTYPTITNDQKTYILQKCFARDERNPYICRRNSNIWFHMAECTAEDPFAVVILSKEFEPNKYRLLCEIFTKKYAKSRNPIELVTLYLNLFTKGDCSFHENGTLHSCNFKDFESVTNIKDLIRTFDLEIILIYTAILLKRRVIIFSGNISSLLNDLLAITDLVPCRKLEDYLYPVVESANQLKGLSFFVAGTTDAELIKHDRLYDIFVDMDAGEIKVAPKAEEIMAMTKTHKEIATLLMKLASSDCSEMEIRQQILQKTKDLINLLQNLTSVTSQNVKMITLNDLKSKKLHPNLENFLFNLAIAENMMIL